MLRSETEEFGPVGYGKMSCFPMAKNRLFLALVSVPETNWFRWYQRVKVNDRKSAKLKWWRSRTMHECESSMASVHLGSTQFESRTSFTLAFPRASIIIDNESTFGTLSEFIGRCLQRTEGGGRGCHSPVAIAKKNPTKSPPMRKLRG